MTAAAVDTSLFPDRCELIARLRDRLEPRPRHFRYWTGHVRLCRGFAVALVQFAGADRPRRVCVAHFNQELLERPAQLDWFEVIRLSKKNRSRLEAMIAEAKRLGKERAPRERSVTSPDPPSA